MHALLRYWYIPKENAYVNRFRYSRSTDRPKNRPTTPNEWNSEHIQLLQSKSPSSVVDRPAFRMDTYSHVAFDWLNVVCTRALYDFKIRIWIRWALCAFHVLCVRACVNRFSACFAKTAKRFWFVCRFFVLILFVGTHLRAIFPKMHWPCRLTLTANLANSKKRIV